MSGPCALNLCGRQDASFELGFGGPWDVARGAAITDFTSRRNLNQRHCKPVLSSILDHLYGILDWVVGQLGHTWFWARFGSLLFGVYRASCVWHWALMEFPLVVGNVSCSPNSG